MLLFLIRGSWLVLCESLDEVCWGFEVFEVAVKVKKVHFVESFDENAKKVI